MESIGHNSIVEGPPTGAAPPRALVTLDGGEIVGEPARPSTLPALQARMRPCTPIERAAAEHFVLHGVQAEAWRVATGNTHERACQRHWSKSCEMFAQPWVREYVAQLRADRMAQHVIDAEAIIASDLAIIAAAEHAPLLSRVVYHNCRYCFGIGHAYQWADELEFCNALVAAEDVNEERRERKQRALALPSDAGGYGFDPALDPNVLCPRCEGQGVRSTIIGDTRNLGPAAALFAGIKETRNGIEVQTHDVGKAKERVLRFCGALGDDAASVARGAAAGAAAGASAGVVAQALAAARAAREMTGDQVTQLYLRVMSGQ